MELKSNITKIIIMYRTAIYASNKIIETESYGIKESCNELVNNFNKGTHVIDKENEINSYSVLNIV